MEDGVASHTARSVAARRLTYERVPAGYGHPEADLALMRDVAAGLEPTAGRMHEFIRARTAFFDRVVVHALDGGMRQVVVGAAGYDGRSLRYAKRGVRWFEVDHPATQADKLERLARLGIDVSHVRFVAADFTTDPVAARLREAGLDDRRPALFLFEGIAVYLEDSVTESVLAQFREVTVAGSLLAMSVSVTSGVADPDSRSRFRERVAAIGEPARSEMGPQEAGALLARVGWAVRDAAEVGDAAAVARRQRLRDAGFITARAVAVPSPGAGKVPDSREPGAGGAGSDGGSAVRPARGRGTGRAGAGSGREAPDERGLPLHALLSRALVAFTIEADNEAGHRLPHRTTDYGLSPGASPGAPWLISLGLWASSLRHVPDEGITVAGLRQAARTGTNLAGVRRWGYVTFDPEPTRGRQPAKDAVIQLTAEGRTARDEWPRVTSEVEERWRERFGTGTVQALRDALEAVAARLPAGLPDSLPILGYGLFSRVPEEIADTGAGAGAEVAAGLPLWALLSRVLLAFAAQYESESPLSLAISANVLRVLTAAGVRARDIPDLAGVSKEAIAMAMGILTKRGLATEERDPAGGRWRVARLTPRGERALDAYHELVADIEDDWNERFGVDAIATLRAALEHLPAQDLLEATDPYPDGWRARLPPLAVLPRYPMVLHRGGHPDGSLCILKKQPGDRHCYQRE